MSESVYAWHFTGDKLRDGRPLPAVGEWLIHEGPVAICIRGLHASRHPYDALQYAPGALMHLVECVDISDEHHDKLVCRRRRIIALMDATEMLRYYARMRALSVVHLWDAPDVVLDFLMTGRQRGAAIYAARNAAWAAAWAAACTAAIDAAENAAWFAARNAGRDAAWAAAMVAERAAERAAAWAAERAAARNDFDSLVYECFEGPMRIIGWEGER